MVASDLHFAERKPIANTAPYVHRQGYAKGVMVHYTLITTVAPLDEFPEGEKMKAREHIQSKTQLIYTL